MQLIEHEGQQYVIVGGRAIGPIQGFDAARKPIARPQITRTKTFPGIPVQTLARARSRQQHGRLRSRRHRQRAVCRDVTVGLPCLLIRPQEHAPGQEDET